MTTLSLLGFSLLGFSPLQLLAITAIMAAATIVQMALGLGLGLVMIPLLALVSTSLVPAPAILSAFLVMAAMIWGRTALIDRPGIGWGTLGLVFGTAAGVAALLAIDPHHLPRVFGAMILLAVVLALVGLKLRAIPRDILGASLVSGFMGGMSGIHGPLIGIVYAGEDPARVRATLGLYWIIAYGLMVAMHALAGRFGLADLASAGLLVPGIVVGYVLAPRVIAHIDRRCMRIGMLAVAVAGALVLILRG
ncbi:sulfite exporter TauE/SafE family protein [Phreatobacter sp.]|uniref:sulfite exporter TauE/SafE family protein n=1 Tax=Phreatobacter sp. TaxID=1966341 RepID=UPI003F6F0ED3